MKPPSWVGLGPRLTSTETALTSVIFIGSPPAGGTILAAGRGRNSMPQRLGIDSYSLRSQGWDAFQFLEYSAQIGLDNVHFSERRNFASLDSDYLRQLRARADE